MVASSHFRTQTATAYTAAELGVRQKVSSRREYQFMKISGITNISDIFNIFHDGSIRKHEYVDSDLILQIDIQYLAERIHKKYTTFSLHLIALEMVVLEPWYDDHDKKEPHVKIIREIFSPELEILSSEVTESVISISCNQSQPGYGYYGGFLKLEVAEATVQDEGGEYLSLEQLRNISSSYWKEWSEKNA